MSTPNTHIQEGSIRLQEQQVSLLDTTPTTPVSTAYILKTGSMSRAVRTIDSDDEHGAYRGFAGALGPISGSGSLQFINSGDKLPQRLQYFSVLDSEGVVVKCVLLDVDDKFGAFEEAVFDIKFRACANPAAITATLPSLTPT